MKRKQNTENLSSDEKLAALSLNNSIFENLKSCSA